MSVRLRFAVVVFVLLAAACQDTSGTLGPEIDLAPAADLIDGTTTGNDFFFFLPPLVDNPRASGVFDPSFQLTVEICELSGSGCVHVASLTPEVEDDHYHASWKTSRSQAGGTYRISVPPLGSVDVDLYANGRPRNSPNAVAKAGSNVPVKFIVEEGAFGQTCEGDCAQASVPDGGGVLQVTSQDSGQEEIVAVLDFPDDWSPDGITRGVTADCDPVPVGTPGTGPLHTDLDQWPLFCQLSLYPPLQPGETFDEPVFVAICNVDDDIQDAYHPADRGLIRLGKQDDGDLAGETFEILDPADPVSVSTALAGCEGVVTQTAFTGSSGTEAGGSGLLAAGWNAVKRGVGSVVDKTLAPRALHAALMFRDGGAGALVSSFSLIGSVEPAVITGTLTTSGGGAISGATVTLSGPASASTTTDGNGAYAFEGLNAGFNGGTVYTVTVSGLPAGELLADSDLDVSVTGSGTFVADFQTSQVFLNPDNGNYYEAVLPPLSWVDADAAAQSLTFQGCVGHLATITSQAENDFITDNMPQVYGGSSNPNGRAGGYWIGGVQAPGSAEPAGGWGWVTGEPFAFTNWAGGEPNNLGNAEHHAHFLGGWAGSVAEAKKWNDEPGQALYGYVVEYECGS